MFLLAQQVVLDHGKDHVPEVFAGANAPFLEDGGGHRAKCEQRILANAIQQLLACNMANLVFVGLANHLLGELKGLSQERVSITVIARIAFHDFA